jgi:peptide/nickel transport system substrate-binding protein
MRSVALEGGQVQVANQIADLDVSRLRFVKSLVVNTYIVPGHPQAHHFNVSIEPTNDINVRKAILYAMDRQGIVNTKYFGTTVPAWSSFSRDLTEWNPATEKMYTYDPKKATQLLEDAGWKLIGNNKIREKDGKKLHVSIIRNPAWHYWTEVLQANMVAVGFDVELVDMAGIAVIDARKSCKYNLPPTGGIYIDPANVDMFSRDGLTYNGNCGTFPKRTQLLDAAKGEVDAAKRTALYKELQMYEMEQALLLPVIELPIHTAAVSNLKGVQIDSTRYYMWFYEASFQ